MRFLAATTEAASTRPFVRTAYSAYDPGLLDPTHPDRIDMAGRGIDCLVLAVLGGLDDWA